jgi:hypothetical protein
MLTLYYLHHPLHDYLNSLSRETQGGENHLQISQLSNLIIWLHILRFILMTQIA